MRHMINHMGFDSDDILLVNKQTLYKPNVFDDHVNSA